MDKEEKRIFRDLLNLPERRPREKERAKEEEAAEKIRREELIEEEEA